MEPLSDADRRKQDATDAFDVVCCALSVQYLQYPAAVFAEFGRVLADGVVVVSFSHRMFPSKAIAAWRRASMADRADLVASYLRASDVTVRRRIASAGPGDPFHAPVGGTDPEGSSTGYY